MLCISVVINLRALVVLLLGPISFTVIDAASTQYVLTNILDITEWPSVSSAHEIRSSY
jgi:hypothetical protein